MLRPCLQEANGGGGGLIGYLDPEADGADSENGRRQFLTFEGTDVKGRTGRLNKGDPVQFLITTDMRTGKKRATQVCCCLPPTIHRTVSCVPLFRETAVHDSVLCCSEDRQEPYYMKFHRRQRQRLRMCSTLAVVPWRLSCHKLKGCKLWRGCALCDFIALGAVQVQRGTQQSQPPPDAPREQGFVDKFMNTYGFVR